MKVIKKFRMKPEADKYRWKQETYSPYDLMVIPWRYVDKGFMRFKWAVVKREYKNGND